VLGGAQAQPGKPTLFPHPPIGAIARDLVVPQLPSHGKSSDVILLIIAIVGTTVAAVLPAEPRDRQAHHAPLYALSTGRSMDRHPARHHRRGRDDGGCGGDLR
jgi:hypothetical protein